MELEIRNLEAAADVKAMENGRFELVSVGGVTVGRATYEPGWRWSEHVGAAQGQRSCSVEHVVLVLSGRMRIAMDDGRAVDVGPGDLCAIPSGHDAWVLGDEPYISLHFVGAEDYV